MAALKDGVHTLEGKITDYGLMTTPQLHFITRCLNTQGTPEAYGEPTEEGYYKKLAEAFKRIVVCPDWLDASSKMRTAEKPKPSTLYVDAANGIGAPALQRLAKVLTEDLISVKVVNDDTASPAKLNLAVCTLNLPRFVSSINNA